MKHSSTSPLTTSNLFLCDGQMALRPVEQISPRVCVCLCVRLFAWTAGPCQSDQTAGLLHAAVVIIRRGFSLSKHKLDVGEWEQRQMKEHEREREREREQVTEIVQLICLCHNSPGLLSPVGVRRGEMGCRTTGFSSKAELKQRFLIRPEKVESKTMSLVHVVRISQGWAATRMIASPKKQGHRFLVVMLNIDVDHYFFPILHLRLQSIPMAQFFSKEPSKLWSNVHNKGNRKFGICKILSHASSEALWMDESVGPPH